MAPELLHYEKLARVILSIFVLDASGSPVVFCGSGFIIGRNVFVTCRHCVDAPLAAGQRYAVVTLTEDEIPLILPLEDLEPDPSGVDLASGTVRFEASVQLQLGGPAYILMGHDVWTFGYPFTEEERRENGDINFTINGRLLRGYVTRTFPYLSRRYGEQSSYEVDMPAPAGLSGAPLMLRGGYEVVGVIYGTIDEATIDQFVRVDSDTGERTPEIQRVLSFGLAHTTPVLRRLRGRATNGMPLEEYLKQ